MLEKKKENPCRHSQETGGLCRARASEVPGAAPAQLPDAGDWNREACRLSRRAL